MGKTKIWLTHTIALIHPRADRKFWTEVDAVAHAQEHPQTEQMNLPQAARPVQDFLPRLPPEVRNIIYKLALGPPYDPSICVTEPVHPDPWRSSGYDHGVLLRRGYVKRPDHYNPVWPSALNLLLTSKQMYLESFHVFYTSHCFSFTDTKFLYRFLRNSGYARRQHITSLHFLWRGPHAKEAFRLLKTCKRLKSVEFVVPCSHPPGYAALCEVRGLEKAEARALIHFQSHRDPGDEIGRHCWGDYLCHCVCRRPGDLVSNLQELETAMMRPRLRRYELDPDETLDLFDGKREHFRRLEEETLVEEKDEFMSTFEE